MSVTGNRVQHVNAPRSNARSGNLSSEDLEIVTASLMSSQWALQRRMCSAGLTIKVNE
jgi:hypothetical protein